MTAALAVLWFVTGAALEAQLVPFNDGLPASGQWRHGFAVEDMNGDGHVDIVHGPPRKGPTRPVIFLGDGKGHWKKWDRAVFPDTAYDYGDAAIGDWNGDGRNDVAFAMHMRGFVLAIGTGNGRFEAIDAGLPYGDPVNPPVFTSRALVAVDWNRDGRTDLVANGEGPRRAASFRGAQGSQGMRLFLNLPGKWEMHSADNDTGFGDAIAVGDFNGDSFPDAVLSSHSLGAHDVVALNDGAHGWRRTALPELPARVLVWSVAAADFDGDNRDEPIVGWLAFDSAGNREHGITRFRFDNDWDAHSVLADAPSAVTALAAGDFDGDGAEDLAAGFDDGAIALWRGTGAGELTAVLLAGAQAQGRCYHLAFADCDGDGADELLGGFAQEIDARDESDGSLRVWKVDVRTAAEAEANRN